MDHGTRTSVCITIEIGRAYLRAGYGGEAEPRVELEIGDRFGSNNRLASPDGNLICRWFDHLSEHEWELMLYPLLEHVYKRLLVRASCFPVVLIVSPSLAVSVDRDEPVRVAVKRVLLEHLQVPVVIPVDPNRATSLALGRIPRPSSMSSPGSSSLLVVDIGRFEGRCICISNGTTIWESLRICPCGLEALVETILLHWNHLRRNGRESSLLYTDIDYRYATYLIGTFHLGYCERDASDIRASMATASLYHQLSSFNTITPETLECIAHSYVKEFYFSLENQHGLLRAFLDSALSCPIDLRRSMLQNVVFIGGSILSMYNMKQYFFTTLTSLFSTKGDFDELPLLVTDMVWNQYSQLLSNLQSTATAAYHENEPIKIADNSLSFLHPLPFSPAHVTWVGGGLCIDNIASLRLNQGEVRPLSVNRGV